MMKWSHTLIAGGVLILLTNAVVLLGAGYNRSEKPESQLILSQRELQHSSWNTKDNSGITLNLNWRIAQAKQNEYGLGYSVGRWGMPAWLDKAKLAELGFDVDKLAGMPEHGRRYKEALPREALLVLELNDAAYQQGLQRAKEVAEQASALQASNPDSEEFKRRAKNADESYKHELQMNSRLFVIDAGLDVQRLRATYSDRARYAVVHGLIRPSVMHEKDGQKMGGYITELHAEKINVPLDYRPVFDELPGGIYEVTVAFGKRLEPWITAAARSAAVK
jgi:hypothetical protein